MQILLAHWHCILPVLGIVVAMFFMRDKDKEKKERQKKRNMLLAAGGAVVVIIVILAITLPGRAPGDNGGASQTIQPGGGLVIPISEISETAGFYPVNVDGTKMEVLAVKAPDGTIRTAFNTCQVCYDSGRGYYKQDGDVLVCQNCGNRFAMSQVEVTKGGCNPWPVFDTDKTVTTDSITITYDFLKESKQIFANWKRS